MLRTTSSARARVAVVITASLALVGAATLTTTTLAHATSSSDLASEQQKASQLEAQIEANGNRVSVLDEQFTSAQLAIQHATDLINADEAQVEAKQRETNAVRDQLQARATELYMGAGNPAPLASLDFSNARQLGSRSAYAGAAADQDRQLLDQVKVAVEQLGLQQASLEKARAAATKERDRLDQARNELTKATQEQQALLAQVKGKIKTLVDEIQAQKEREQEAAARASMERLQREQELAAQRANQATIIDSNGGTSNGGSFNGGSSNGGSSNGGSSAGDPGVPAPSAQAQIAVDAAKAQLGKPYEYAGSGPGSFDCSGLTMYAWSAAGVSLSHNAEAQYQSLPHVSQSSLEPGDLVFYGAPIHHVGIYAGGGEMIEAPYTGVDVRYHTIYRSDYAGAARP